MPWTQKQCENYFGAIMAAVMRCLSPARRTSDTACFHLVPASGYCLFDVPMRAPQHAAVQLLFLFNGKFASRYENEKTADE